MKKIKIGVFGKIGIKIGEEFISSNIEDLKGEDIDKILSGGGRDLLVNNGEEMWEEAKEEEVKEEEVIIEAQMEALGEREEEVKNDIIGKIKKNVKDEKRGGK